MYYALLSGFKLGYPKHVILPKHTILFVKKLSQQMKNPKRSQPFNEASKSPQSVLKKNALGAF